MPCYGIDGNGLFIEVFSFEFLDIPPSIVMIEQRRPGIWDSDPRDVRPIGIRAEFEELEQFPCVDNLAVVNDRIVGIPIHGMFARSIVLRVLGSS